MSPTFRHHSPLYQRGGSRERPDGSATITLSGGAIEIIGPSTALEILPDDAELLGMALVLAAKRARREAKGRK